MPLPTRVYLQTQPDTFRRFLWFQNNKENEMLMSVYGLSGGTSILRYIWPEYLLSEAELGSVRYNYSDATRVDKTIDHITCHADGRFHIKTKAGKDLYIHAMQRTEPLGPNTSTFLEFIVSSDLASKYSPRNKAPKYPYIWINLSSDQYISLRGMFAGVNYDIERDMLATMSQFRGNHMGVVLESGSIKGVLMGEPKTITSEALAGRPRGTLISFKFPVAQRKWLLKTFAFE